MKILDFLSTSTSQFFCISENKAVKKRHQSLLIYKCLTSNNLVIFWFYLHLEKYDEKILNVPLVTIGGSSDIYSYLNGQWSLETPSNLA